MCRFHITSRPKSQFFHSRATHKQTELLNVVHHVLKRSCEGRVENVRTKPATLSATSFRAETEFLTSPPLPTCTQACSCRLFNRRAAEVHTPASNMIEPFVQTRVAMAPDEFFVKPNFTEQQCASLHRHFKKKTRPSKHHLSAGHVKGFAQVEVYNCRRRHVSERSQCAIGHHRSQGRTCILTVPRAGPAYWSGASTSSSSSFFLKVLAIQAPASCGAHFLEAMSVGTIAPCDGFSC